MAITEISISIIHHVAIVIFLLWLLNAFNYGRPLFYFLSLVYLYQVNERYVLRLRRKLQFEERRNANQRRVLLESETVRWLNHAIEKIWPVCMEDIVSQRIFLPIIPWFLDKYKPWTIKKAAIEQLYLGRKPPIFTEMRVLHESSDDDHLVLELGLNFLTADDMSAVLAAKLRKTLGFGIVAKMHITSMHVEGKVLVGVKFIRDWPYISRLRICFAEPPYFQMTVKPIINHGVDVTEVPGIAGWLDNLLAVAFEETLVEPNMLVVDMEKFVSPEPSSKTANWFSVCAKEPIAYVRLEVIEGVNMKPSDINGLADPYVKGQLGSYRFRTTVQRKTLTPNWLEEFKIPICSWESDNVLNIEVRDKDHFTDDHLGVCSVDISQFKDGQRRDMWIPLENVKTGRLHLAITVIPADSKPTQETSRPVQPPKSEMAAEANCSSGLSKNSRKFADTFEAIDIEGQKETGMWVHRPGSDISQIKELRKGRSRRQSDTEIQREGESVVSTPKESSRRSGQNYSNSDDHEQGDKSSHHHRNIISRGMHRISSVFRRSHKEKEDHVTENQDTETTASDVERDQGENERSPENTMAQAESKVSENISRNSVEEVKDKGINYVDSESTDDDSLLNENFVEGVPIRLSEAANNSDNGKTNSSEEVSVDTRDLPQASEESDKEVASKN